MAENIRNRDASGAANTCSTPVNGRDNLRGCDAIGLSPQSLFTKYVTNGPRRTSRLCSFRTCSIIVWPNI